MFNNTCKYARNTIKHSGYAYEILKGNKKYEFRNKSLNKDVKEVLVYATEPVGKIICKFYVGEIMKDKPEELWKNLGDFPGLTEREFFTYFSGSKNGVAIEINDVEKFAEPIDPREIYAKFIPPQSWIYVPDSYSGGENDQE